MYRQLPHSEKHIMPIRVQNRRAHSSREDHRCDVRGPAKRAIDGVLNFFFPPVCLGCDIRCHEDGFCSACQSRMSVTAKALCTRCGRPFSSGPNHICATCLEKPPRFDIARACATYARDNENDPLARAIHGLKYKRDVAYAPALAKFFSENLPLPHRHDAIVPVPLHVERLRWRGFNQAILVARQLATERKVPIAVEALRRTRATPPQVGLGEDERRRNIAGAFSVHPQWSAGNKRILLVDDVYTTGATVNECAHVLRKAGARAIDVAVLARAR